MNESLMRKYSIGIIAQDKLPTTHEVEVTPIEVLGYLDGEIDTTQTPVSHSGVDAQGNAYTVKVTASNTLKATWYNHAGGNRQTSPDVCVGERVQIWKYADVDIYYWTDMGDANHLRSLETVRSVFSASTDTTVTALDPTNSYYHEVSTHAGTITVGTSKANGEKYGYTHQINAKAGTVVVADDAGNSIFMDSNKQTIGFKNSAGALVNVVGANCIITIPNAITMNFDSITMNGNTFNNNVKTVTFMGATFTASYSNATLTGGTLTISSILKVAAVATFSTAASFLGALMNLGKSVGIDHTHTTTSPGEPTSPVI
jgi:hypothetical protein